MVKDRLPPRAPAQTGRPPIEGVVMFLLAGAVFVVSGFLLLYPFVLYPLILSVLPRRPILRQGAGGPAPRMALLFAARNEARDLPVTLRSLQSLKQHWPE